MGKLDEIRALGGGEMARRFTVSAKNARGVKVRVPVHPEEGPRVIHPEMARDLELEAAKAEIAKLRKKVAELSTRVDKPSTKLSTVDTKLSTPVDTGDTPVDRKAYQREWARKKRAARHATKASQRSEP
jgi:hypothetical protein